MRKRKILIGGLLGLCLVFGTFISNGQQYYKLDAGKSSLKVTGTSTVHDWTMVAGQYDCRVDASLDEKKDLKITGLKFQCKTVSITSDHSLMNDKAHEALKAAQYKEISFRTFDEQLLVVNGGTIKGKLHGALQIAGQTINTNLPFEGTLDTDGFVKIKGEHQLKMSAFKIKAPTAMMGTIKTGDVVTVHYEFIFKPSI